MKTIAQHLVIQTSPATRSKVQLAEQDLSSVQTTSLADDVAVPWRIEAIRSSDDVMASSHRVSCLVLSVFAVWTELVTRQDCLRLKISKQFCPVSKCDMSWLSWVLSCPDPVSNSHTTWLPMVTSYLETGSRLVLKCVHTTDKTRQNCSVSNILKTVCDCHELSSHRQQDKTRQSCVVGVGGEN